MVQVVDKGYLCMRAWSMSLDLGRMGMGWGLCCFDCAALINMQLEQACLLGCWC